jgi:crystallin, alpha B
LFSSIATLKKIKFYKKVHLDVKQFKPEEITAKHVDNIIIIEGRHEERQDEHGYVSRHFVRRYILPNDVDIEKCKVQISSDGVLNFCVPKKVSFYSSS